MHATWRGNNEGMRSQTADDSERSFKAWQGVSAVVGVALVGALVFMMVLLTSLSGLEVVTDGQPWECAKSTVDLHSQDEGLFILVVDAVPNMNCKLRFFVRNDGSREATIESIEMPLFGDDAGIAVSAVGLSSIRNVMEGALPGAPNAKWNVSDVIGPGEVLDYELWVEFRPSGCSSPGAVTHFDDWPIVTARGRFNSGIVDSGVAPVGIRGTEFSSCDG